MNWLNAAFAFVFFCNLAFMVGAVYLLMRIMESTDQSRIDLLRAASQTIEAGNHLKVVAKRTITEMERVNDGHNVRENSSVRAVSELSFQIKTLIERLQKSMAKAGLREDGTAAGAAADAAHMATEDVRAKLHAELNAALAKNHQLQEEIEQTKYRLKDATHSNSELRQEISEVKGVNQNVIDSLMRRASELEDQLSKARERAKQAELHAQAHATQLDEIRTQVNQAESFGASPQGIDQTGLIESQQAQIDMLAAREKALMERITQLEGEFQRNQTEKRFIEERFLQLDADAKPPGAAGA